MSTIAEIREVFKDNLFTDDDILAVTEKIYDYNLLTESESDYSKLKYKNKINFLTLQITRATQEKISNCAEYIYSIQLVYFLELDKEGVQEHACLAFLELLLTKIRTVLGGQLLDTVDGYLTNSNPFTISLVDIENKKCVRGEIALSARKFIEY